MHLTITLTIALLVVGVLVVAAYYYSSGKPTVPQYPSGSTQTSTAAVSSGQQADAAAITALDAELNSATQNISTSNVESSIAAQ